MRFDSALAAVAVSALLLACNQKSGGSTPDAPQTASSEKAAAVVSITGTDYAPSLSALYDTVWVRAVRGDTAGLVRLMVDDSMFRREIFPLSDAYDSVRQDVFELVRGMDKVASVRGLKRLLAGAAEKGAQRPLPSTSLVENTPSGRVLHSVPRRQKSGSRLFGAALCGPDGCQVGTYAGADLDADSGN